MKRCDFNPQLEELQPIYSPEVPEECEPEPLPDLEAIDVTVITETVTIDPDAEALINKPMDANSDIVANKNLTDDEIALLILEEEELLPEQGVLGYKYRL